MKGFVHGVKVSQFSLILIGFVCATVVILAWTKTPLLASLTPTPTVVQLDRDEAVIEIVKQNSDAVQTVRKQADLATSKGIQPEHGKETVEENRSSGQNVTKQDSADSSGIEHAVETQGNLSATEKKESPTSAIGSPRSDEVSEGKSESNEAENHVATPESSSIIELPTNKEETGSVSLTTKKEDCKYGKGKWVVDDNRPLYSGHGCKQWLSPMWACRLTQRTDFEYEKLRWQPKECTMVEFTASNFLKRMRDKTLAFVGDSLGRQQFQSLMCMLTGGEERSDVLDVGREFGLIKARHAARPDGWAYRFPITNTTILYYWSASLCDLEPIDASNPATDIAMHMDRPPAFVRRYLHKFNVLVLNTGHHWNRGKLNANRWVMHVGGMPNTNRRLADISHAKNFTIHSIVKWVDSQLPLNPGLKAFFRTISPRHFFNGDWNNGGTCDNTTPLVGGKEVLREDSSDPQIAGAVIGTRVKLLDITALSELRDEGHISRYSIKATPGVQDCLHWCLPGVPDTWNEILYAQL